MHVKLTYGSHQQVPDISIQTDFVISTPVQLWEHQSGWVIDRVMDLLLEKIEDYKDGDVKQRQLLVRLFTVQRHYLIDVRRFDVDIRVGIVAIPPNSCQHLQIPWPPTLRADRSPSTDQRFLPVCRISYY
jgi:hypothetical protein